MTLGRCRNVNSLLLLLLRGEEDIVTLHKSMFHYRAGHMLVMSCMSLSDSFPDPTVSPARIVARHLLLGCDFVWPIATERGT